MWAFTRAKHRIIAFAPKPKDKKKKDEISVKSVARSVVVERD